jgi:prepilin-type N-terminal cleavage/methylation domain-containing protein
MADGTLRVWIFIARRRQKTQAVPQPKKGGKRMKKFMQKVTKSFHAGEKGFTLIELLIVIVILGVLAAAIVPNLSKFVNSGNIAKANAELSAVRTAISAYQSENGASLPTATPATGGAVVTTLIQPYIQGAIAGTYTLDANGNVTAATYLSFSFDGTKFK